jgi:hypothetical protein
MAPSASYYHNVKTSFSKNGQSNLAESTSIFLNDFIHSAGCIDYSLCYPYCEHAHTLEFLSLSLEVLASLLQGYDRIPKLWDYKLT